MDNVMKEYTGTSASTKSDDMCDRGVRFMVDLTMRPELLRQVHFSLKNITVSRVQSTQKSP